MSTPMITDLSDHDRFSIINGVQDWCEAAAWYEPGYTTRQNIREAFSLIRKAYELGRSSNLRQDPHFSMDYALHLLDDETYQMREAASTRPGPTALGLNACQI